MNLENLHIAWFDFAALLVVMLGVSLGRRQGMSKELLSFVQWCLIIFVGCIAYQPVGALVGPLLGLNETLAGIFGYILVALAIKIAFGFVRKAIGERLENSFMFGKLEYYLGMMAGGWRFGCVLLVTLAVLHASAGTAGSGDKLAKSQVENFGAVYFPTLRMLHDGVFKESFTGRWIGANLAFLLLPAPTQTAPPKR
jgi:uncharacterized membrane protein required for colicin V production